MRSGGGSPPVGLSGGANAHESTQHNTDIWLQSHAHFLYLARLHEPRGLGPEPILYFIQFRNVFCIL